MFYVNIDQTFCSNLNNSFIINEVGSLFTGNITCIIIWDTSQPVSLTVTLN